MKRGMWPNPGMFELLHIDRGACRATLEALHPYIADC